MKNKELLQYIGDDITLLECEAIYTLGHDIVIKAGKVYIKYGEVITE